MGALAGQDRQSEGSRIKQLLKNTPVIPLIQCNDPSDAVQSARALLNGGITSAELVLRTPDSLFCLEAIATGVPNMSIGAGTVLSVEHARRAVSAGAEFIVSPGLDEEIVEYALIENIPCLQGVSTASEIQRAKKVGLDVVKVFPASLLGGVAAIRTFSSVFTKMSFVPTGGLNQDSYMDYLAVTSVVSCGGSWIVSQQRVAERDFKGIEQAARRIIEDDSKMEATQ